MIATDRDKIRQRADAIRAANRQKRDHPEPTIVAAPPGGQPTDVSIGDPCTKRTGFPGLAGKAASLIKTVMSRAVDDAVFQERMSLCCECPHVTRARGKHYCECCTCPHWSLGSVGSELEFKNTRRAWACPREQPAFGSED